MKAFHSFWSKPNKNKNNGKINIPDFELLTMCLSALEWKKHNGKINMITDSDGLKYLTDLGLDVLWDDISTSLDDVDDAIDPFLFWAAGKLYALKSMSAPCVMLDTDLIVWRKIDAFDYADVIAAHSEDLDPYVYPDPNSFHIKNALTGQESDTVSVLHESKKIQPAHYPYPTDWDFTLKAANTAFLYIGNEDFKNLYTDHALGFFKNVDTDGLNPINAMCFAEQRILPMCAKSYGQKLGFLFDLSEKDEQNLVTHTWGMKQQMLDNKELYDAFCKKCLERLKNDFPEFYNSHISKLANCFAVYS